MQPTHMTQDELEYVERKVVEDIVETSHGIPIDPPKKKELPKRGSFLVLDGMPMVVLSKSDKCGTLHLKRLSDREIAEMIQKQQKWTDEDLAKMGSTTEEVETAVEEFMKE